MIFVQLFVFRYVLANAIVLQAVKDYRTSLEALKINPNHKISIAEKKECEDFFRSAWYRTLSSVDVEMLIAKLTEEAGL